MNGNVEIYNLLINLVIISKIHWSIIYNIYNIKIKSEGYKKIKNIVL